MVIAEAVDGIETIAKARTDGIRFVQLQFTDIIGHVKAVTIPIHQLEGSVRHGTWFDGLVHRGLHADRRVRPVPHARHGRRSPRSRGSRRRAPRGTARVICDVYTPRGEPFVGDPRGSCSAARSSAPGSWATSSTPARSWSSSCSAATRDGRIEPLPHDQAGYFDFSTDLAQEVRQDMVDALEAFGISVEAAHHEVAAGQHEIDFEYADALKTADNAITFKFALKAIAQQHGLYATFMPKPIHGINGSGMHTHQSACTRSPTGGTPSPTRTNPTACQRRRAQLHGRDPRPRPGHDRGPRAARELATSASCPGYEAPTYLTWGRTNRSRAHPRPDGLARQVHRGRPAARCAARIPRPTPTSRSRR